MRHMRSGSRKNRASDPRRSRPDAPAQRIRTISHWLLEVLQEDIEKFESLLETQDVDEWTDVEFKGTFDSWKENLAKAVSGFANTSGGLLVFGVDAKATHHLARRVASKPLDDLKHRVALVRDVISRAVEDSLDVTPTPLAFESPSSISDSGYIAIDVPRSERRPHIAKLGGLHRYYIRAGEEFVRMPHGILRDMFSRAAEPRPTISLQIVSGGTRAVSIQA